MALTKVQIISNALIELGHKPVTSLQGADNITASAEYVFDRLLPTALSTHPWRFSVKIEQLAQLVDEPVVDDWLYIYQMPADYKKLIRLYPHNYAYKIYGDKMYSNMDGPLYLEYNADVGIEDLPFYFTEYMIYRLAKTLAISNAHKADFYSVLKKEESVAFSTALAADTQNNPQSPLQSQPIIAARTVNLESGQPTGLGE
jgi:hypothetical protein